MSGTRRERRGATDLESSGRGAPATDDELVDFADITEIELRVLRRMKEYTLGDHGSVFHGTGVDFVGLRDWQAGDRLSSIDWPQSSLTNFTPMVMREYEQPGTAPDRGRGGSVAVDAMRRRAACPSPRASPARWRPSGCRRSTSRTCSASSRSTKGLPAWRRCVRASGAAT